MSSKKILVFMEDFFNTTLITKVLGGRNYFVFSLISILLINS